MVVVVVVFGFVVVVVVLGERLALELEEEEEEEEEEGRSVWWAVRWSRVGQAGRTGQEQARQGRSKMACDRPPKRAKDTREKHRRRVREASAG